MSPAVLFLIASMVTQTKGMMSPTLNSHGKRGTCCVCTNLTKSRHSHRLAGGCPSGKAPHLLPTAAVNPRPKKRNFSPTNIVDLSVNVLLLSLFLFALQVQDKAGRVLGGGVANRFEGRLNMIKV